MKKRNILAVLLLFSSGAGAQVTTINYARMLNGVNYQTGTSYTFTTADTVRVTQFNNASPVAVTLPNGGTFGFQGGIVVTARNAGAGVATITCSGCTINGSATLSLGTGQSTDMYSDGLNYMATQGGFVGPVTPPAQPGDILRFNVSGDSAWDPVRYTQAFGGEYSVAFGGPITVGFAGGFAQSGGMVVGDILATATSYAGRTFANNAIANTNAFGMLLGQDGNGSVNFPFLASYRTCFKLQLFLLTNSRYWFGLGTFENGSGVGTNGTAILGTTKYATDTPNSNTIGFRFSSTTDTDFQAVVISAGVGQTTVDTGVVADLNPHLFEFCPNATGTAIAFFIDTKLVATISTNLPPLAAGRASYGSLFWVLDNKNTATATKIGFFLMESIPKFG